MKVYNIYAGEVYSDGESQIKVLDIYDGEVTLFIKGPDMYRVMRGSIEDAINIVNLVTNVRSDFDDEESERIADYANYQSFCMMRLVSARPEDYDFNPHADYCYHDTKYMLDCETGELYDL